MNRRVRPGENRDPRQDEQKDRRKEIMAIFQSTENMEHISRQELEDKLDTVLDRVLRENIGLGITDDGKDVVVVFLRQVQIFLAALTKAKPQKSARTDGVLRLQRLIALVRRVGLRVDPC